MSEDSQEERRLTSPGERHDPAPLSDQSTRWWLHPAAVASLLTIVCLPLRSTVPRAGLDPSWQLGISLVHVRGIAAGPGFVFTYGPLGFLAQPNIVWITGAILGLGYIVAATFALYFLVCRSLREWLPPIAAVASAAVVAVVTVLSGSAEASNVAELATAALLLWALTLVRPGLLTRALPVWVPLAFGGAAALQLLVKFSAGGGAILVGLIVAGARSPRLRNLALFSAAFVGALFILWLAAQQSFANLTEWLRGSFQVTVGYSSAMALPGNAWTRYWFLWLVSAGVLVFTLWRFVREHHARALPFVALVAVAAWLFTKAGFVRLDGLHAKIAFFSFAVIIVVIPWERRWMPVGLLGLAVALGAVVVAGGVTTVPSDLRSLATQQRLGMIEAGRIVRATLQPSYRSSELNAARRSIQATYGVPESVAAGLRGAQVHADPTEIAAVWAYGLLWRPVPVFQTYNAYTLSLDEANAEDLRSRHGPDAVLREPGGFSLGRVPAWESPSYMVTLTCSYQLIAEARGWQALTRTSSACGPPREISHAVLHAGASVPVPSPRNRHDIVAATFDYPTSALEWVATTLLKPSHTPIVLTNGHQNVFVAGTAAHLHLLHVPETIGARRITNAGLDIRRLSFPNAPSAITVHFFEVSTG